MPVYRFTWTACILRTVPTFVTAHMHYVLRILRYSGFLRVVPSNTGIFLRSLKLFRESSTQQVLLVPKKKFGVTMHFFRDNKASIWKKMPYIALYFTVFYEKFIVA